LVPHRSHRAKIIDDLIRNFDQWWLIGVKSTKYWGWDMWDQANQFVGEGENGGLLALVTFIWLLSRCFSRLGTARKLVEGDRAKEWQFYLLGTVLFAYIVSFFGMSFSNGPEIYPWYALLAIIAVTTTPLLQTSESTAPAETQVEKTYTLRPVPAMSARDRLVP
jgi:hypothetical protein